MTDQEFLQLQKDNIKNRETFLNSFGEEARQELEKDLIEIEKSYGQLLGAASITLPNKRYCMVEKYESSYVVNFGSEDLEVKTVRLSYEGFYAFGLLWNGFRTEEDAKHFFECFDKGEAENGK